MPKDFRFEPEYRIRDFIQRAEHPFPPHNPLREHPVHRWDREADVRAAKDELDRRRREEEERVERERRERMQREENERVEREKRWERERQEDEERRAREDLESTFRWADAAHRARRV